MRRVADALNERGIKTFLDERSLIPGQQWQGKLVDALNEYDCAAVFLGPHGLGIWQHNELQLAQNRQAREGDDFPVIPVLLNGWDIERTPPGFLELFTWVDLRDPGEVEYEILAAAVRGETPEAAVRVREDAGQLVNPYRGLGYFREEDAPFYFGRDALIEELEDKVKTCRLIGIVGGSGSGKSSLARAGLLPLLRRPENECVWQVLTMTPGQDPALRLADTLAPHLEPDLREAGLHAEVKQLAKILRSGNDDDADALGRFVRRLREKSLGVDCVLLLVDQFEELYTLCDDDELRMHFLDKLIAALSDNEIPLTVVTTLRGDHYHRVTEHRAFNKLFRPGQVNVTPLTRQELVMTIEKPAAKVDLALEEGLTERILDEVEGEPGALPLLEFLLEKLWQNRDNKRSLLTHQAYDDLGGVKEAIARRADEVFQRMPVSQQRATREVLLRLVRPGQGVLDSKRAADLRLQEDELDDDTREAIKTLTKERLIVTDKERIDITHEALIREWSRLKRWVNKFREDLLLRDRLEPEAEQWLELVETGDQRAEELLLRRGLRLDEAKRLRDHNAILLEGFPEIRAFIKASAEADEMARGQEERRRKAEEERRAAEQERRLCDAEAVAHAKKRTAQRTVLGLIAALVFGVVAGWQWILAISETKRANTERHRAEAALITAEHEKEKADNERRRAEEALVRARDSEAIALKQKRVADRRSQELDRQRQVLQKTQNAALLGQSKFLADSSTQQTKAGDFAAALLLALEAIQDTRATDKSQRERPYWPPAEVALDVAVRAQQEIAVLMGHESGVISVSVTRDGSRIVTGSLDKTARVWDAESGAEIGVLRGHEGWVTSVDVTPDGLRMVTGSSDKTVRILDTVSLAETAILTGHKDEVWSVAVTPDGSRIITGSLDKTARVWDVETGSEVAVLAGHESGVLSVGVTPDGSRIVTGSWDNTARVWDAGTHAETVVLRGHQDAVTSVAVAPDSSRIITGSRDGTVRIWNAGTGAEIAVLKGHEDRVISVALTPDGSRIVTGSGDGTVRIWDAGTGASIALLRGHDGPVLSVAVTPDGARIITGSLDKTARVWNAVKGAASSVLKGHTKRVMSVAVTHDGSRIVTGSLDKSARVWNAETGAKIAQLKGHKGVVSSVAVTYDGSRIITGSWDETVRIWNAKTGAEIAVLSGHDSWVSSVAITPDGSRIVAGVFDNTARVWNAWTGAEIFQLRGHKGAVLSVAVTTDGARIITGSGDKTARVWDASTGALIAVLNGHHSSVLSVAVTPDGSRVVTASRDKTVRIWDAGTGAEIGVLKGHKGGVRSIAIMPGGSRVITGSEDKTARVWELATGVEVAVLKGHEGTVRSLTVTPDGSRIITGSDDTTARVWDNFKTTQALIDLSKASVPRCLTRAERERFYLAPEPPSWCITKHKWPYQTEEWKRWLAAKDADQKTPLPDGSNN